ncbi:MAG: alpha/beta fold hydrolase, partial [Bacilli bacterium]
MNRKYNKMILVFFMCLIFLGIVSTNIKIFADVTGEWQNYQIYDIDLYKQTNTYDYNVQPSDDLYNLNSRNEEYVSADDPQITIFTHGLAASAQDWSNENGKFTYQEDSLITQLRGQATGAKVYWYKITSENKLKIIDIGAMTDDMITGDYLKEQYESDQEAYYATEGKSNYRIMNTSLPIIILFEANIKNSESSSNDIIYKQFNYAVSKVVYDFKFSHNGILPRINLIGHSRGGIINMMYALDHPDLVDSIFSMGTPYLGSTTASIDVYGLGCSNCKTCQAGEKDIVNPEIYNKYRDRWNNNFDRLYSDINVYAIGSYSTWDFVKEYINKGREYIVTDETGITEEKFNTILSLLDYVEERKTGLSILKLLYDDKIYSLCVSMIEIVVNVKFSEKDADDREIIAANLKRILSEITFNKLDILRTTLIWENDGLVNLSSQLGEGETKTSGYIGFIPKIICFMESNSNITKIAQENVPVVHNLETRDDKIIAYILKNIKMQGKDNSNAFMFGTHPTDDGTGIVIKSILKNIDDNTNVLEIPATINGKSVVEIGKNAFANNFNDDNNIKYVVIPSSVTTIGENAFEDCENLERIIFSGDNNLENIGEYAFYNCFALTDFTFIDSVPSVSIGGNVFSNTAYVGLDKYNSKNYYDMGSINCRTDEIEQNCYLHKGYSSYFKIDLECQTHYDFFATAYNTIDFVLYDENMNEIFEAPLENAGGNTLFINKVLEAGTYILVVAFQDENIEGNVKIGFDNNSTGRYEIVENEEVDALEHLHDDCNEFSFMSNTDGFYNFVLEGESEELIEYPENAITIKDLSGNVVQKYEYANYSNDAATNSGGTNIILFANAYYNYYIDIHIAKEGLTALTFKISPLTNFELNENDYYTDNPELKNGDEMKILNISRTGEYNFNFIYSGNQESNILCLLLKKNSEDGYSEIDSFYLNADMPNYIDNYALNTGENIYIGYYNGLGNGNISIEISRNVSSNFDLLTDPNENVTVGSEVTLNGGNYSGSSITQGYTRICYLGNDAPDLNSRTNYHWSTSDSEIAIVSNYGTVTATATWDGDETSMTVNISATYKNDSTIIGEKTFTVYKDNDTT